MMLSENGQRVYKICSAVYTFQALNTTVGHPGFWTKKIRATADFFRYRFSGSAGKEIWFPLVCNGGKPV